MQLDASPHNWFGSEITHLHLGIDDATGKLLGAYFDKQETLNAYYQITHQILNDYGIPAKFLTDRRTVFEYKKKVFFQNTPKEKTRKKYNQISCIIKTGDSYVKR